MKQKSWDYIRQFHNEEEGKTLNYTEWEDGTITIEYFTKHGLMAQLPVETARQGMMLFGIYKRMMLGEPI